MNQPEPLSSLRAPAASAAPRLDLRFLNEKAIGSIRLQIDEAEKQADEVLAEGENRAAAIRRRADEEARAIMQQAERRAREVRQQAAASADAVEISARMRANRLFADTENRIWASLSNGAVPAPARPTRMLARKKSKTAARKSVAVAPAMVEEPVLVAAAPAPVVKEPRARKVAVAASAPIVETPVVRSLPQAADPLTIDMFSQAIVELATPSRIELASEAEAEYDYEAERVDAAAQAEAVARAEAHARAEAVARAEAESIARAEAAARMEAEAIARTEAAARAGAEAAARMHAVARAEAEATERIQAAARTEAEATARAEAIARGAAAARAEAVAALMAAGAAEQARTAEPEGEVRKVVPLLAEPRPRAVAAPDPSVVPLVAEPRPRPRVEPVAAEEKPASTVISAARFLKDAQRREAEAIAMAAQALTRANMPAPAEDLIRVGSARGPVATYVRAATPPPSRSTQPARDPLLLRVLPRDDDDYLHFAIAGEFSFADVLALRQDVTEIPGADDVDITLESNVAMTLSLRSLDPEGTLFALQRLGRLPLLLQESEPEVEVVEAAPAPAPAKRKGFGAALQALRLPSRPPVTR